MAYGFLSRPACVCMFMPCSDSHDTHPTPSGHTHTHREDITPHLAACPLATLKHKHLMAGSHVIFLPSCSQSLREQALGLLWSHPEAKTICYNSTCLNQDAHQILAGKHCHIRAAHKPLKNDKSDRPAQAKSLAAIALNVTHDQGTATSKVLSTSCA